MNNCSNQITGSIPSIEMSKECQELLTNPGNKISSLDQLGPDIRSRLIETWRHMGLLETEILIA